MDWAWVPLKPTPLPPQEPEPRQSVPPRQRASLLKKVPRSLLISVNFATETHALHCRSTGMWWEIRSAEQLKHSLRKYSVTLWSSCCQLLSKLFLCLSSGAMGIEPIANFRGDLQRVRVC